MKIQKYHFIGIILPFLFLLLVRVLREFHRVSRRYAVVSFFNYRRFGAIQRWLKRLRGRRPPYEVHPTAAEFAAEAAEAGFRVRDTVQVGPFWEAQEFYVLDKAQ